MGKTIKSVVGGITGGLTEKIKPTIANKQYWDIGKEVAPAQQNYADLLSNSQAVQQAVAPQRLDVLTQMGKAALGQGPSLAEVQMKAAQDRNLAQQLAIIKGSRGGNAATQQRQLAQSMSTSGRQLAQDAGAARLQERGDFLNQANLAGQEVRQDVGQKLNIDLMPKQSLQGWEASRVGAVNQAQAANAASQNALTGAIIGGGASILAGKAGKAEGGQVRMSEYKKGGKVSGPGTETSDSIPTMLSDKEFVVKAAVAKQPAILQALKKINAQKPLSKKDMSALSKALTAKKKE